MVTIELEGRAVVLGDDVNTDYIISSSRKKATLDPVALSRYLFESLDASLAGTICDGDILVAGKNFGCGSAMEVAVTAVLAAGVRAIVARSFSRTYFRNAINNGLVPLECETRGIVAGSTLRLVLTGDGARVVDLASGRRLAGRPLPGVMLDILSEGGLVPYFRKYRGYGDR
jgi:3-isopropylmalate/(R)-2-methylmalate dehydratase small subunit